jgi:hypothetical protein
MKVSLIILSKSVLKIFRMKGCAIYYWVNKNKLFIINGYRLNLVYLLGLKYKETFLANKMNKLLLK